jgi:hypothetical protein
MWIPISFAIKLPSAPRAKAVMQMVCAAPIPPILEQISPNMLQHHASIPRAPSIHDRAQFHIADALLF